MPILAVSLVGPWYACLRGGFGRTIGIVSLLVTNAPAASLSDAVRGYAARNHAPGQGDQMKAFRERGSAKRSRAYWNG